MSVVSDIDIDIDDQATALLDFDTSPFPSILVNYLRLKYDRIILTGTGTAHLAALPVSRRVLSAGWAVCWINSTHLLGRPDLLTGKALVVATSGSGDEPQIEALMRLCATADIDPVVVAITDDIRSPLALQADCSVLLRSHTRPGTSTQSFLNMLTAHDLVGSLLLNQDCDDVSLTAGIVAASALPRQLVDAAAVWASITTPRLAFIGYQDHAAVALYAAMIAQEAAGVPAEGFIGEEFEYNPVAFGGPCLMAFLFGGKAASSNPTLRRLATTLADTGSTVVVVGAAGVVGALHIEVPATHGSGELAHAAVLAQRFISELARAGLGFACGDGASHSEHGGR